MTSWKTVKNKNQQKREKQAEKYWRCQKCDYQWCFLSRSRCYKCNAFKQTSPGSQKQNPDQNKAVGNPPRQGWHPYTEGDGDPTPPKSSTNISMMDYVNAPLKFAQQSGITIPAFIAAEKEDTDMTPVPKTRAPKISQDNLPETYFTQRDELRSAIEKSESIIKLLDPVHDKERIREYELMITRDKSAISSLKPLPHRIESLQRVVDAQAQRVMRANQVISNWQLLRDAWQEKHDHHARDLQEMKRQHAEIQAQEVGSKLEQSGSEQQLSQLQSHVQQLTQLLQGIITTAQYSSMDTQAFANLLGTANQTLVSIQHGHQQQQQPLLAASPVHTNSFPQCPASLGRVQSQDCAGSPLHGAAMGGMSSPLPGMPTPLAGKPLTTVPTPARASHTEDTHGDTRRIRSHSPRRGTRVSRSPFSPTIMDSLTMSDAQEQEEMLRKAENAMMSPICKADLPVPSSPVVADMRG